MQLTAGRMTSTAGLRAAVARRSRPAGARAFERVQHSHRRGELRIAPLRSASPATEIPTQADGEVKGRKLTLFRTLVSAVERRILKSLDIKDVQEKTVANISPAEIKKCIQYAAWAYASYAKDTNEARARVRNTGREQGVTANSKLLDDSVVILSGSSKLDLRMVIPGLVKTDTQATLGLLEDGKGGVELVVAFRGSETTSDWLTDFFIDLDPASELVPGLEKEIQVHAGFTDSVNDFLTDKSVNLYGDHDATIEDRRLYKGALEKKKNNKPLSEAEQKALQLSQISTLKDLVLKLAAGKKITKVAWCGHSLGGALATLAAFWSTQPGKDGQVPFPGARVEYYSFGAPRVGNPAFVELWDAAIFKKDHTCAYRVMHRHDPVPGVPAANIPIPLPNKIISKPYTHVEGGVLLCQPAVEPFIGNQGLPKEWPMPTVDKDGYQAQRRRRPIDFDNTVADDHGMDKWYIPALLSALKNSA